MQTYISFTKKGLFVIFAAIFCVCFIFCEISAVSIQNKNADTNGERLTFIKNLGYEVTDNQPTTKTVNIPEVFYDVYENYNNIQKKADYDLSAYKGCEVIIYTYQIAPFGDNADECVLNLIVYNDKIIGGDVSSVSLGGVMLPLKRVID